jgi:hypothetical protein
LKVFDEDFILEKFPERVDNIWCGGFYFPVFGYGVFLRGKEFNVFPIHSKDLLDGAVVDWEVIELPFLLFLQLCEVSVDAIPDLITFLFFLLAGDSSGQVTIKVGHKACNFYLNRISIISHGIDFYERNLLMLFYT